jgi:hypothetical protein
MGLLAAVLVGGCSLPEAPGRLRWDTHLSVPFGTRTYGLASLVMPDSVRRDSGSGIGARSDSVLFFSAFTEIAIPLQDSLTVDPVTDSLFKPDWVRDTTGHFPLPAMRHRMVYGRVDSGRVQFSVQNLSAAVARPVDVYFPSLQRDRATGAPLHLRVSVPAAPGRFDTSFSLQYYWFVFADTVAPSVAMRLVDSNQVVLAARLEPSRLTFKEYRGYLDSLRLESAFVGRHLDALPEGYDSVHVDSMNAFIEVPPSIGGIADVGLDLRTFYNRSLMGSMHVQQDHVNLTTLSTQEVTGLSALIPQTVYPDSLVAGGTTVLSGYVEGRADDSVRLQVELRAPMVFRLGQVHAPGTISKVENSDLDSVQSARLTVRIWNGLPAGGRVFLVVDRDSNRVRDGYAGPAWPDTLLDVAVAPGVRVGRSASTPTFTELTVQIDSAHHARLLDWLRQPPFFTRTDVSLTSSDGEQRVALTSDYIKVQPILEVWQRMDTGD